jgi:3-keto-disaccharide hydrolase
MKYALLLLLTAGALCAADPVALTLNDFTDTKGAPPPPGWVTETDGTIHRIAKSGDLISKQDYSSFQIEWEWKVAEGANSGLKYWVNNFPKGDKPNWLGIEYQMIDDDRHPDAKKGDNHNTASIYDIKGRIDDAPVKPAGQWNTSKVIVKDGKIQHFLNGMLVDEADTTTDEWKAAIAKSKFAKVQGFAPGKGRFLLQDHGDEVWFKNIRVTPY